MNTIYYISILVINNSIIRRAMKISQELLKKFFPRDNRFIYYVMKRNKRVVYSDEWIDSIRYYALVTVMNAVNKDKEFDSIEHIHNWVMTAIDCGYRNTVKHYNAPTRNMVRVFSEYGSRGDSYSGSGELSFESIFENSLSHNQQYDDTVEVIYKELNRMSTPHRMQYFEEHIVEGKTPSQIARDRGVSTSAVSEQVRRLRKDCEKILKSLRLDGHYPILK